MDLNNDLLQFLQNEELGLQKTTSYPSLIIQFQTKRKTRKTKMYTIQETSDTDVINQLSQHLAFK